MNKQATETNILFSKVVEISATSKWYSNESDAEDECEQLLEEKEEKRIEQEESKGYQYTQAVTHPFSIDHNTGTDKYQCSGKRELYFAKDDKAGMVEDNTYQKSLHDIDGAEKTDESDGIFTDTFGGQGGTDFPNTMVKTIGVRMGDDIDQVNINDNLYGSATGIDGGTITLNEGEFINHYGIRAGDRLHYAYFSTNKGRSVGGGSGTRGELKEKDNIRILFIGGRYAARVHQLRIKYIVGYEESQVVESNVIFIADFVAPGTELTMYEEHSTRVLDGYRKVSQTMMRQTYKASVKIDFKVKAELATGLEFKTTDTNTIWKEMEDTLITHRQTVMKVDSDSVGMGILRGNIMKGADGTFWMFPTGPVNYILAKLNNLKYYFGKYDLTGVLDSQVPDLAEFATEKNGYKRYEMKG